jgi:putative DNA methylase
LSKKKDRPTWVIPVVASGSVTFKIQVGGTGPDPEGTVGRSGATCVACDSPVPLKYVRDQGRSGRLGATLMAVVAEGDRQRVYLPADPSHIEAAEIPAPANIPDSDLPERALGFRVQAYGMTQHKDLFTNRQLVALAALSDLVHEARERAVADALAAGRGDDPRSLQDGGTGAVAYAESVAVYLAFGVSKVSNLGSSLVGWMSDRGALRETFARQAISMVWDFAEPAPLGDSGGSWATCIEKVALSVASCPANRPVGSVVQQDAARIAPRRSVVSTDPPYYDNVAYADLSDYFYVWLRRAARTCPQARSTPSSLSRSRSPRSSRLSPAPCS